MNPVVFVVHCVDTEGPLSEPVSATFERLKSIFGIDIPPSLAALTQLQRREIDLNGLEDEVARVVDPHVLGYKEDWGAVDAMLDRIMAPQFRDGTLDSFGQGWVYNWHCVAHVGYAANPRRRDIGWHNIFDHYRERIAESGERDGLHFHFHPMPFSRQANHNAAHWFANGGSLFEVLARRIIERNWFPAVNRPGFHVERAESHWFLEQFIPFDFANQALAVHTAAAPDMADGRWGDWRRAPATWQPYHPAHDDHQSSGRCRRWLARCLNVGTRKDLLQQADVDQAFAEAREGKPVVLSFTDHDFRDMAADIETVRTMIADAARRFSGVKFRYCEAREAMRLALGLDDAPGSLSMSLDGNRLTVLADRPTFGPQPFLAIQTRAGQFAHDNFDIQEPFLHWSYVFDEQTVPLDGIERIGVGTAFPNGAAVTSVLDLRGGGVTRTVL
ncbi:MAG: hypothetical protein HY985_01340 [Magnetospirillum sp.]|nr:hypothetical protein [Magnetospirillum sp.]